MTMNLNAIAPAQTTDAGQLHTHIMDVLNEIKSHYVQFDNDTLISLRKCIDGILQDREVYKIQLRAERRQAKTKVPLHVIVSELNSHLGYDITKSNRTPKYTMPRFAVFYILFYEYKFQLERIGKYYGGLDHSSVIHGRDMAKEWIENPDRRPEFWDVYVNILAFLDKLLCVGTENTANGQ